ncbi:SMEK domain-containing protein [Echinicola shivajiensis]|uniref:SMEK domain-containing protein n=1 Tax=Echinicola shivajiensis TaxID=1035916 RepID=UPI001BFC77FC|nr:SMEK domain-containing protein [Echinicola shivajiensis]
MNEREQDLKSISNEFANWEVKIANLNSLNFYDANIISENTVCELLNMVFSYQLININSKSKNQAAIDLGDETNRISYQITSTKTSQKIQKSLDTFFENELENSYDELFFPILGKKQKKYPKLNLPTGFSFEPQRNILDFRDLLHFISFLPNSKIKKVNKILLEHNSSPQPRSASTKANRIKRNLALKKRMKRELLVDLDRQHWKRAMYEPYIRFKYHNIIIRSVENDTFPDDHEITGKMSNWFKGEFWDFYDNGLELIGRGGEAIFDKDGHWDILDWRKDSRRTSSNYEVVSYQDFLRIPYEYIVELDMDTDQYYALPALYVEYAKDGMPYEEILPGIAGTFEHKQLTYYFDKEMKKELK